VEQAAIHRPYRVAHTLEMVVATEVLVLEIQLPVEVAVLVVTLVMAAQALLMEEHLMPVLVAEAVVVLVVMTPESPAITTSFMPLVAVVASVFLAKALVEQQEQQALPQVVAVVVVEALVEMEFKAGALG
jgi:hypothetical protein